MIHWTVHWTELHYVHENRYYHYRTLRSNKQRHPRAPSPAASPVAQQSLRLAQHLPAGSSQACLAEQCGRQGQMGDKQDAPSLLQCLQASPLFRVRVSGCAARRFSIKNSNVLATARPLAPNANVKPINRQSSVPAQRCLSSSWPPECDWGSMARAGTMSCHQCPPCPHVPCGAAAPGASRVGRQCGRAAPFSCQRAAAVARCSAQEALRLRRRVATLPASPAHGEGKSESLSDARWLLVKI